MYMLMYTRANIDINSMTHKLTKAVRAKKHTSHTHTTHSNIEYTYFIRNKFLMLSEIQMCIVIARAVVRKYKK